MAPDDHLGATMHASPGDIAAAENAAPPSLLADRYEVLALLGVGGMGRVYRVHDRALDEVVALKMLKGELIGAAESLERFRREVKLARLVTSPHVIRTFDLGQHEGEHFLTMEYLAGRSLSGVIEEGPIAVEEALRIVRAVATGIAAAHAAGVLHRDLKPDNILVSPTGRIAITDFGIARIAATTGGSVDHFVGTPAYMAPEQVDGGHPISPATDIYAIGAILYEMLVGRRPFTGDNAIQLAIARLDKPPPDPRLARKIPDPIADLVIACMGLDPATRPADGTALVTALANLAATPNVTMPQQLAPVVPAKGSRSVAVLPLRSTAELAELADGLGEEIVDGLTQTRALRVRPMQAVRGAYKPDADPRELGRALGVDVVVDGSVRRIGEITRIAARAIGVVDGFQLSADRIDAKSDELLSAGDAVARAIAAALTVELPASTPRVTDPRATALYLEGKSRLAARWMLGPLEPAIDALQRAYDIAPEDPSIAATLARALARYSFFGGESYMLPARSIAERVVARRPEEGDGWLALGFSHLYANEIADAGRAFMRAVRRAPGLAFAQAGLGAILLEAGAVEEAIAHLEGALAIDPTSLAALWDLSRAMYFVGRHEQAFSMLEVFSGEKMYAEISLARLKMWSGVKHDTKSEIDPNIKGAFRRFGEISANVHRTFALTASERDELAELAQVANPRLRATRSQFITEFLMVVGDHGRALEFLRIAVDAGLRDQTWMTRCPVLAPLRSHPTFLELAAVVEHRADEVRNSIASA